MVVTESGRKPSMRVLWFATFVALMTLPGAAQAQQTKPVVISTWEAVYPLDPRFEAIVPADLKVERIAQGLGYVEGPVWDRRRGLLLFSDMRNNAIYKWDPKDGKTSVLLDRAGFAGTDPTGLGSESKVGTEVYYTIGPNGVTLDPQGRVVFCAVGDRQIVQLENDGRRTVLASQYDGKRFGGPNDLVIKSNGSIYFTDTYSGLRGRDTNPNKELSFSGVYLLKGGKVQLLLKDRTPNGIALNPSQTHLYVNDSPTHTIWRYEIKPDDTLGSGAPLVTLNAPRGPGGTKFDSAGNMYASVAGAVWVLSPEGKHLGTVLFPQYISNIGFGDSDAKTLYATGRTEVYRLRVNIAGVVP
jgi:gluconolactonase